MYHIVVVTEQRIGHHTCILFVFVHHFLNTVPC